MAADRMFTVPLDLSASSPGLPCLSFSKLRENLNALHGEGHDAEAGSGGGD